MTIMKQLKITYQQEEQFLEVKSMVKVKCFIRHEEYESNGRVIYSAQYEFSKWDQKDVKSIVSIHTCANTSGSCEQILVFYEPVEESPS